MRARLVVIGLIGLFGLACTGAVEVVEDEESEEVVDDGGDEPTKRKKKRRPRDGEDGGDDEEAAPKPGPSPAPGPAPPTPAGIVQIDSTTWQVDKKLKDKWMDDPGKLGCNANEKGKGYELKGITNSDDAWHIGLRNGDVVKEVNGYSLATEAEAIAAYAACKDAKKLRVKIKRGDGPIHHTYIID